MPDAPDSDPLPLVRRCLPDLSADQRARLGRMTALVRKWNERVNLISRRDIDNLELHHVLHSLAVFRVWRPARGTTAIDIGTGGGFPGLPLAILYPDCRFTLVDSIGKKIRAVADIAACLGLENVRVLARRAEQTSETYDYIFGRAVAALPTFLGWAAPLLRPGDAGSPPNGVFYFKGTQYRTELEDTPHRPAQVWPLQDFFDDRHFAGKYLLHFAAPLAGNRAHRTGA